MAYPLQAILRTSSKSQTTMIILFSISFCFIINKFSHWISDQCEKQMHYRHRYHISLCEADGPDQMFAIKKW